jgi:predicted DCC family thiol-disulfide oxidoreductase YuxK
MPEPIVVVYDGQCGFCTRALALVQHLDRWHVIRAHDAHEAGIRHALPMLSTADFENALFAVTSTGKVYRGYFAFKRLLRSLPLAWPVLPLFYVPGASFIGPRVYAWVARNRHKFGCESDVCEVVPAPDKPIR